MMSKMKWVRMNWRHRYHGEYSHYAEFPCHFRYSVHPEAQDLRHLLTQKFGPASLETKDSYHWVRNPEWYLEKVKSRTRVYFRDPAVMTFLMLTKDS